MYNVAHLARETIRRKDMPISKNAASINASPTLSLNAKAQSLHAEGRPVINLSVGEPKNETPAVAAEKATDRLASGSIKYAPTTGTKELKDAIIDYTRSHYGRTPQRENVVVTVGAKQALFNALLTILDPGDEVVLLAPYWVSYPEMVKMSGAMPVVAMPQDGTFVHSLETVEPLLSEKTKAIILNSPNNPCGVVYPPAFIQSVVQRCEQECIYLIMDDIYHKLTYTEPNWVSAYDFSDREIDASHLIVINGVSKSYGMTGFRIGWLVASQDIATVVGNIQGQSTSGASIISQDAALGALTGPQTVISDLMGVLNANRKAVLDSFADFDAVCLDPPEGAFYAFPDFSAYNPDSQSLAAFLLEKALVVTVPGAAFGLDGHLRLSYAGAQEDIVEGIKRIRWALDPAAPDKIDMGEKTVVRDWL
jgi:aspartate aminotransferase